MFQLDIRPEGQKLPSRPPNSNLLDYMVKTAVGFVIVAEDRLAMLVGDAGLYTPGGTFPPGSHGLTPLEVGLIRLRDDFNAAEAGLGDALVTRESAEGASLVVEELFGQMNVHGSVVMPSCERYYALHASPAWLERLGPFQHLLGSFWWSCGNLETQGDLPFDRLGNLVLAQDFLYWKGAGMPREANGKPWRFRYTEKIDNSIKPVRAPRMTAEVLKMIYG